MLANHRLPEPILQAYQRRGIRRLYDWQALCLGTPGVAEGHNLVYCAPTSGGKTIVSEILMLRRISELQKRAIFVLPYVSIVVEKARHFQELCAKTKLVVKRFYGGSNDTFRDKYDIAVCTIEKANALVNRLIEEGTLAEVLCSVVVDEIHLVGDSSRGYLLEVMLSKLRFLAPDIQIVGMSATLPNICDLQRWLRAELFQTDYRPVPLTEYILVGSELGGKDGRPVRRLDHDGLPTDDRNNLPMIAATWEVTKDGHCVLIFCCSKAKCEKAAQVLAERLPVSPSEEGFREQREKMIAGLQRQPCGLDKVLERALARGVAFHHSGLTTEERSIVERGYRDGYVNVICATSTLAAGVNLPARRVIFQTPYMGKYFLDSTQYKQMSGRAGRAGQGDFGESVVIANQNNRRQVLELMAQELPRVSSCLGNNDRGLKRLLLEVLSTVEGIGSGQDLIRFCESTLLVAQKPPRDGDAAGDPVKEHPEIAHAVQWLLTHDMARVDPRSQGYVATPLGRAVCASALEPAQGYLLFQELQRARPCVSLDTDLHICYLVTPPEGHIPVDFTVLTNVLRHLSGAERRVVERAGVRLDIIDLARVQGSLPSVSRDSIDGMRIVRFFSALVLWAVLHEVPMPMLRQRFQVGHGHLQQLQQTAAAFTQTVATFCAKLNWFGLEALVLSFQQRLTFGVRSELVPLMEIPGMDCVVARALYEQGFTTPVGLVGARPPEILRVLRRTLPHGVPSAALPEENAERLIEAAKAFAKSTMKEKRQKASEAQRELREGVATEAFEPHIMKRQRLAERSVATAASTDPAMAAAAAGGIAQLLPDAVSDLRRPSMRSAQDETISQQWANNQPRPQQQQRPPPHQNQQPQQLQELQQEPQQPQPEPQRSSQQPRQHPEQQAQTDRKRPQPPQPQSQRQQPQWPPRQQREQPPQHVQQHHRPQQSLQLQQMQRPPERPRQQPQQPQQQEQFRQMGAGTRETPTLVERGHRADVPLWALRSGASGPGEGDGDRLLEGGPLPRVPLPSSQASSGAPAAVWEPDADTDVDGRGCSPNCSSPLRARGAALAGVSADDSEAAAMVGEARWLQRALAAAATPSRTPCAALPPLSPEQLCEGLRRIGRQALTPDDVDAVSGQRRAQRSGDGATQGLSPSGPPVHEAMESVAAFMASDFDRKQQGLSLPRLTVIVPSDIVSHQRLGARLMACSYAGAGVLTGAVDGAELLFLTLGVSEAYCVILPATGLPAGSEATCRWFMDQRNLCVAPDAKEVVAALLRRGLDACCSFAEPRIALWLLDPDDKQHTTVAEIATAVQVRLCTPAMGVTFEILAGNGVQQIPVSRTQLSAFWSEAFLSLPVMACLLEKLVGQRLQDSFWCVEMPIATVLAWMEHFGIAVQVRDPTYMHSHMLYRLAALQEHARQIVGRPVVLGSSEDVGRALFEDLAIPPPRGTRFKRKNNGRIAYKSPSELLRQLPPHPLVDHVLEHRHLTHAARRIESLCRAGGPVRPEPRCADLRCCCRALPPSTVCPGLGRAHGDAPASVTAGASGPATAEGVADAARPLPGGAAALSHSLQQTLPLPRVHGEFVQTGTATGRLATACGSLPLLSLENPFWMCEVWRPSLHDEMRAECPAPADAPEESAQSAGLVGARVFVAVARAPPPGPRLLREGRLEAVTALTCADPYIGGGCEPLSAYWVAHGWETYEDDGYSQQVRQILVRHGSSVLSYPADQVWRLSAPVRLMDDGAPRVLVNPRKLLVADAGRVLFSVDYAQLEVRIMAHFSQDERFVRILHGDGDFFRHVAAGWLRKPEAEVTAEERGGAKRICYGLIYGIGAGRLAVELGISRAQAREFQESFMREYAGIAAWVRSVREVARRRGYVETLHSRRRFLPQLASRSRQEREHAERQAVNTSCQASAADLVKAAMLAIHARLKRMRSHIGGGCRMVARLLLQIHDELVFEVDEDCLDQVREMVVAEMIAVGHVLRVPLEVKWKSGKTFGTLA